MNKNLRAVMEARRNNLRSLMKQTELRNKLLDKLRMTPGWLSQMIGPKASRNVTERKARDIEEALELPSGYLDVARGN